MVGRELYLRLVRKQFFEIEYENFLYDLEEDPGEHRDLRFFFPEKIDELDELAEALTDALEAAADEWDAAAEAIEPFEVGLEKTDITVEDIVLVWVPTA